MIAGGFDLLDTHMSPSICAASAQSNFKAPLSPALDKAIAGEPRIYAGEPSISGGKRSRLSHGVVAR